MIDLARGIERRDVYWTNRSLGRRIDNGIEEVELVVSSSENAALLFRFVIQLNEALNHRDSYGSILRTVGSWKSSTIITVLLAPPKFSGLLDELENIPEVAIVEEKLLAMSGSSSIPKEFSFLLIPSKSPSKRIHVGLKETNKARRELANVLN